MNKVAIYGTGIFAKRFYEICKESDDVQCFIDEFYTDNLYDLNVYKAKSIPKDLINIFDKVYICIEKKEHKLKAKERLLEIGISEKQIVDNVYPYEDVAKGFLIKHLSHGNKEKYIELMNHQELDLQGMFGVDNQEGLRKCLNLIMKNNIKVLEVGSWKGVSSAVIADAIKEHNGKLFCVDIWPDLKQTYYWDRKEFVDVKKSIFHTFLDNMDILGFKDIVKPLRMSSFELADLLQDDQFDLIFIDAGHAYDFVYNDIKNLLPKLKKGGIICGDDCKTYYKNLPSEYVEKYKNDDYAPIDFGLNARYHCGVIKALDVHFKDNYNIEPNSSFWWRYKE